MSDRRGVYPGSFNPPTHAHLAIADAARRTHDLDHVDLALSRVPLTKEHVSVPTFEHRMEVLEQVVAEHDWLGLLVTDAQLIVEISDGYDVVIMGADKWHQIQDAAFYNNSDAERDRAMKALPTVAVAPRPPLEVPTEIVLDIAPDLQLISSSGARSGHRSWMHPCAQTFDLETGAWTDQDRYLRARAD